jgi:hypothetical protein
MFTGAVSLGIGVGGTVVGVALGALPGVDDVVGVRLGIVVAAGVAVGVAPMMVVGDGGT